MNSGQYGHERSVTTMTPERLNELANYCERRTASDEEKEIASFLHECAKAESVAVISSVLSGGHVLDYKYDVVNRLPVGTKLYAAPQVSEPANIRERWNIERDGDDLLVCFNDHEKGQGCRYERFVRAPQVSPELSTINERAEFESRHSWLELKKDAAGMYQSEQTYQRWEGWQARAKLSAPQQQPFSLLKSSPVSYSANASDAPQVSQLIDERAEFEKWAKANATNRFPDLSREGDGYFGSSTDWAWKAWQAARKLSAPKVVPATAAEVVSKTTDTVVPDEKSESITDNNFNDWAVQYAKGWNACRAAMQAHCDAMLKGEK